MEDKLVSRLEIATAAIREGGDEARWLRSEAREEVALQRDKLWWLQEERKAIRYNVSQASARLRERRVSRQLTSEGLS